MNETVTLENGMICRYYSPKEAPFTIHGLYRPLTEDRFKRLPTDVAAAPKTDVLPLSTHTAGGRVRFATDSSFLHLKVTLSHFAVLPHMPILSCDGFDLYRLENGKEFFHNSFKPPVDGSTSFELHADLEGGKMHEYTLYLPLFTGINDLKIGLSQDAKVQTHRPYRIPVPVVFYGSSITHGACCSRAGLTYEARICRKLDCDHTNLGFAGNCRAEKIVVDHIASLDMSAFVLDYDHNAPNVEHLQNTHFYAYEAVRKAHPDIPIVIVSKPDFRYHSDENVLRRNVVYGSFIKAYESGDRNVFFVDGAQLFDPDVRTDCTVDGCHPNDLGFCGMAKTIGAVLEAALDRHF